MKNRLLEIRKEKGLSLKDVQKEINLPVNTLSQYERYKLTVSNSRWDILSEFYDLPVAFLAGYDDRKYSISLYNRLTALLDTHQDPFLEAKKSLFSVAESPFELTNLNDETVSFCERCYQKNIDFKTDKELWDAFIKYLQVHAFNYSKAYYIDSLTDRSNHFAQLVNTKKMTSSEAFEAITTYINVLSAERDRLRNSSIVNNDEI